MVTLIMLCAEPCDKVAESMATAAAAHKAEYNSLTEACILLLYGLTYPENIMRKHDKEKYPDTGGCCNFKGMFNNGAKDSITSSLSEVSCMIQDAIDFLAAHLKATHLWMD